MNNSSRKISCIIPTYNEAPRIASVLEAITTTAHIHEIIVVDDGSTDDTREIVTAFPSVRYIQHSINQGKSIAVLTGLKEATGELVLFLDADLMGLTAQAITSLISPVLANTADVSISLRKNAPYLWHMIGIDYISGERVLPRNLFQTQFEEITQLPHYGLEIFINQQLIKNKYRIAVVSLPHVKSPYKIEKFGLLNGALSETKMMLDIFRTRSFLTPLKQIYLLRKQRVNPKIQPLSISLIIPAYNEEKYIGECLRSALKNGQGMITEILVIDNASTDRTAEIASGFPGVRVVRENQKGITRARQRGYKESTGEILAFIDADTKMPPRWIQNIPLKFMDKNLACLSGPYFYYDTNMFEKLLITIYWQVFAFPIYFFLGYMVVGGNFAIRRTILDKMNGFDTTIDFYGEDTNIARRAKEFGTVAFSNAFTMYTSARRIHDHGIFKLAWIYVINFFSEVIRHKPAQKKYVDIR